MYTLIVADNNSTSEFGPFPTKRDAVKERTQLISAYRYSRKYGFNRVVDGNIVWFHHSIYSTVKFEIINH